MGLLGAIIGTLLSVSIFYAITDGFNTLGNENTSNPNGTQITILPISEDPTLAEAVAAKVVPSIVNIDVFGPITALHPFLDFGLGENSGALTQYGLGSGIIISEDGYILTNYHVIEGGTKFLVGINGSVQLEATLVGGDPQSDLAVLKVEATGLRPIDIGNSADVTVGEWVMAVGSPFGLERSVSTGVVSALYRSTTLEGASGISIYVNMIQTDAAINPGNSGGALVDRQGHLIGITTLISSASGSSSGVGFAISINYAMNIVEQIMSGNPVQHAYLGVTLRTVNSATAKTLGVEATSGAYVESVVSGSPADRAGIQSGDVVIGFNDKTIVSATDLVISVRGKQVGDTITLKVMRGSRVLDIEVTLGATP